MDGCLLKVEPTALHVFPLPQIYLETLTRQTETQNSAEALQMNQVTESYLLA